ncbi:hypothetical protein P4S64_14970 [Vibrio sp. M60_M31a]
MGKTTVAAFIAACPQVDTIKIKGRGKKSLDSFMTCLPLTLKSPMYRLSIP